MHDARLDPRTVIPLSDADIELLTKKAIEADTVYKEPTVLQSASWLSLGTYILGAVALVSAFTPIALTLTPVLVVMLVLAKAIDFRAQKPVPPPKLTDEQKLVAVVKYLSYRPIQFSESLCKRIDQDRLKISHSLGELQQIHDALQTELGLTTEEELIFVIQSRVEVSDEAMENLRKLDEELLAQKSQAIAAAVPVREMRDKFERLLRLSNSLSKIQAAHQLIEDAQDSVAGNRIEIKILQAITTNAMDQLTDIDRLVAAQQAARKELLA